jgi:Mg2+ and Co2+ transporter CorA
VKEQVREMSAYLDSDSQRRQSATVLRLTVVTIFGLIATVVTGYFGMNLFSFPEVPESRKLLQFSLVTGATLGLVLFAVARSKRLSDFLEAMSDERLDLRAKWTSLARVFRKPEE